MTSLDILLPFWGDVIYLKRAVDSVREQTDPDWRLVVVDNAYPDETVARWFADLTRPPDHLLEERHQSRG